MESSSVKDAVPLNLDDDKHPTELDKEFNGATLEISGGNAEEVTFRGGAQSAHIHLEQSQEPPPPPSELSRDRPGSTMSRASVRSTSSKTSVRPGYIKSDNQVNNYYSYKEANFQKAVSCCKKIIKPELDGEFINAWLLTEVNHWDMEKEKLVFLTKNSVFIIHYNFITDKMLGFQRIMLHVILEIAIGDFEYPSASANFARQHGGIQIRWGDANDVSFGQRWNPWCGTIPWVTLCHHPILYHPKENETVTYNVDDFFESVVGAISKVYSEKKPGENLKVLEGPIHIESYIGVQAMIYNQSNLGYFRDRNGACF